MMLQDTRRSVIDYTAYINEHTHHFIGREWVFKAINDWLADPTGSRAFLLVGEPGSGKTAIACRLSQFSLGIVPPPDDLRYLVPQFLGGVHFCSVRDSRWIIPRVFIESLAAQLVERCPAYAQLLIKQSGDRQIHIEVHQHIKRGRGIGVIINQLGISELAPEDAFNRFIRTPLEELFREGTIQKIVILLDALDEALDYSGNVSIVSLLAHSNELPPGVRFLLTSRQDARVSNALPDADEYVFSASNFERSNQEDIRQYVKNRLCDDQRLSERVVQIESKQVAHLTEVITRKAEGNFLYTRFLLDAIATDRRALNELEGLPEGLDGLYLNSLDRVVRLGKHDWLHEYAPLIGTLSVAQEGLTLAQLLAFTNQSKTSVLVYLRNLQQFIEEVRPGERGERESKYRLYHQSVIDFLHRRLLSINDKQLENPYHLSAEEWHSILTDRCEQGNLSDIWKDIKYNPAEQGRREYARQHYITHLHNAGKWQRLFSVLDAGKYGRGKVQLYDLSAHSYAQDLELGRQAACWNGWEIDEGMPLLGNLWRYTLLRCCLASRAESYTFGDFEILLWEGHESEALGLAEFLTRSDFKMKVLLQIVDWGGMQSSLALMRAYEAAFKIKDPYTKDSVLRDAGRALARTQQWKYTEEVVHALHEITYRDDVLLELGQALAWANEWELAEEIIPLIHNDWYKFWVLQDLALAMSWMQEWNRAEGVWSRVEAVRQKIPKNANDRTFSQIWESLSPTKQWNRIEEVVHATVGGDGRDDVLLRLAIVNVRMHRWEHAEALVQMVEDKVTIVWSLFVLGEALYFMDQRERTQTIRNQAKKVWNSLRASGEKIVDEYGFDVLDVTWEGKKEYWIEGGVAWDVIKEVWGEDEDRWRLIRDLQGPWGAHVARSEFNATEEDELQDEVLRELVLALTRAKQLDQARNLVDAIQDKSERVKTLHELVEIQASTGQQEHTEMFRPELETASRTIMEGDWNGETTEEFRKSQDQKQLLDSSEKVPITAPLNNERYDALLELGVVLTLAQRQGAEEVWAEVEARAQLIEVSGQRDEALRRFAAALLRVQRWDSAEAVARSIEGHQSNAKALRELGMALAQAQHWDRAEAVLRSIHDKKRRAKALRELGMALAQAQHWDRAEAVLRSIQKSDVKASALQELATVLTQAQLRDRAEILWNEAEIAASAIQETLRRTEVLGDLCKALSRANQWDRAEAVLLSIPGYKAKYRALQELRVALAQTKQQDHGEKVWAEVEELCLEAELITRIPLMERQHIKGLWDQVKALAKVQQWDQAQTVACSIQENAARNGALRILEKELIQTQQWDRAEEIVNLIQGSRPEAREELYTALREAHEWKRAQSLTRFIGNPFQRSAALRELGRALTQAREWRLAEEVWCEAELEAYRIMHIKKSKQEEGIASLKELVDTLTVHRKYELMLRVVQRSWLMAETRMHAIALLPLAFGFIPLKPELGTVFHEAFTWVDNFLKGERAEKSSGTSRRRDR